MWSVLRAVKAPSNTAVNEPASASRSLKSCSCIFRWGGAFAKLQLHGIPISVSPNPVLGSKSRLAVYICGHLPLRWLTVGLDNLGEFGGCHAK